MSQSGPLSIKLDLSKQKTSVPVIADGHNCRVRFVKAQQSDGEKGQAIKFEYHLLEPAPTVDGGEVKAGFPIFENVTLYDKNTPAGEIPEWAAQKIAKIMDAFLGTGDPDNKKGKPQRPEFDSNAVAEMTGKECWVKVKAKVGGDHEGNDVTSRTFPGDIQS